MWSYIQEKYDIPENGKKWTMNAIDSAFRGYKSRFKEDHYYTYPNDEIRMANRPKTVPNLYLRICFTIRTPKNLRISPMLTNRIKKCGSILNCWQNKFCSNLRGKKE